eukprot:6181873-Pleurochrysis_carterae.AAC.1
MFSLRYTYSGFVHVASDNNLRLVLNRPTTELGTTGITSRVVCNQMCAKRLHNTEHAPANLSMSGTQTRDSCDQSLAELVRRHDNVSCNFLWIACA